MLQNFEKNKGKSHKKKYFFKNQNQKKKLLNFPKNASFQSSCLPNH